METITVKELKEIPEKCEEKLIARIEKLEKEVEDLKRELENLKTSSSSKIVSKKTFTYEVLSIDTSDNVSIINLETEYEYVADMDWLCARYPITCDRVKEGVTFTGRDIEDYMEMEEE